MFGTILDTCLLPKGLIKGQQGDKLLFGPENGTKNWCWLVINNKPKMSKTNLEPILNPCGPKWLFKTKRHIKWLECFFWTKNGSKGKF